MALATESYAYSRSSSFSARSPDTASAVYPERAIRPLPKSRLKSRLSPEQVSSIIYPPNPPPPLSPTVNPNATENGSRHVPTESIDGLTYRSHRHETTHTHDHCLCQHEDGDSGDEEVEFDHPDYRYVTSTPAAVVNGKPVDSVQRRLMEAAKLNDKSSSATAASIASSADGYESFENTSNKKKRKIPLSSASGGIHQSRLSAELANMGISQNHNDNDGSRSAGYSVESNSPYDVSSPQSSVAGTGISGAGRGRYGRREAKDGRRPLANTTVNTVNGYHGRVPSRNGVEGKTSDYVPTSPTAQTPGIISRAIRTAAEAGPLTPQKGKENVSLLQQSANSASPKTQFTFTCESDSSNKMLEQIPQNNDPYRDRSMHQTSQRVMPNGRNQAVQGTQTAYPPRTNSQMHPDGRVPQHAPQAQQQHQQQQPIQKPPRPRRSPSKEYALAARQRKIRQQDSNYHHRPRREDMWICQFCEYEDIFGVPPSALIRAYEIKDRQEQKKAAEKQRLLEKAKQRGRKGKKGSGKNNGKGQGATAAAPVQDHHFDQNGAPIDGDDEFYDEDGYVDDYEPTGPDDDDGEYDSAEYYPPPPPVPQSTPQGNHHGGRHNAEENVGFEEYCQSERRQARNQAESAILCEPYQTFDYGAGLQNQNRVQATPASEAIIRDCTRHPREESAEANTQDDAQRSQEGMAEEVDQASDADVQSIITILQHAAISASSPSSPPIPAINPARDLQTSAETSYELQDNVQSEILNAHQIDDTIPSTPSVLDVPAITITRASEERAPESEKSDTESDSETQQGLDGAQDEEEDRVADSNCWQFWFKRWLC